MRTTADFALDKKAVQHYLIDHDLTHGDFAKTPDLISQPAAERPQGHSAEHPVPHCRRDGHRHTRARDNRDRGERTMNFADYVEPEKRAAAHGIGDDPAPAQLLHIIQFKEVVKNGHERTMREPDVREKNIARDVGQRIKEAMVADGCDGRMMSNG